MSDTPVFIDMQGFIVNGQFAVKEFAMLRNERELIHYIFRPPISWNLLTANEKSQACWLTANHHGLQWKDGDVEYAVAKTLIRNAVSDEAIARVYIKGVEKKRWLIEIIGSAPHMTVTNIDADYDDIGPLQRLSTVRTLRCGRHTNICSMENVLKLYNWWCERRDTLRNIQPTTSDTPTTEDTQEKEWP